MLQGFGHKLINTHWTWEKIEYKLFPSKLNSNNILPIRDLSYHINNFNYNPSNLLHFSYKSCFNSKECIDVVE